MSWFSGVFAMCWKALETFLLACAGAGLLKQSLGLVLLVVYLVLAACSYCCDIILLNAEKMPPRRPMCPAVFPQLNLMIMHADIHCK